MEKEYKVILEVYRQPTQQICVRVMAQSDSEARRLAIQDAIVLGYKVRTQLYCEVV